MRKLGIFAVAALATVVFAVNAQAALYPWDAIDWTGTNVTKIKFTNYEVLWDRDTESYKQEPLEVNDVVIQILKATSIIWETAEGDVTKWSDMNDGELTAYSVAVVTDITDGVATYGPLTDTASANDPLEVSWDANEVVRIYLDSNQNFSANSGDRSTDVGTATDGTLLASFGFGDAVDAGLGGATGTPFLTSNTDIPVSVSGALNVKDSGSFRPDLVFRPVSPLENNSATITSTITANSTNSNWPLRSEDPFRFRVVPEPSSLAGLAGLALVGLGGVCLRRRRKA